MGRAARYDDDEIVSRSIGERIRAVRQGRGLTMDQLARALDLSTQQIHKYEHGTNRIAVPVLMRIAEVLHIPIAYFLPETAVDEGAGEMEEFPEADLVDALLDLAPGEIEALRNVLDAQPRIRKLALVLAGTIVGELEAESPATRREPVQNISRHS